MIPVIVFCPGEARIRASGTDVSRWTKPAEAAKKTVKKQSYHGDKVRRFYFQKANAPCPNSENKEETTNPNGLPRASAYLTTKTHDYLLSMENK
ncbi:hypothetical protein [Dickeya dianthicola]|uniref:hypothetical protein n=1 Tax=Dickeya dianthicola TaxID=204039 RepID=UPI0018678C2B|nr:hypothetical protein [Dickeya dianthicola]QOL13072.1 hypothetical protein HGI48_01800 [Dickeya dianthicola]